MEQKEIIYILCEGNSETNYITKLNKFLDNEEIILLFNQKIYMDVSRQKQILKRALIVE